MHQELSSQTRGVNALVVMELLSTTNVIDFVTMATTGNATDFGDLLTAKTCMPQVIQFVDFIGGGESLKYKCD